MVRMGLGTDGIGSPMVRLGSVSGVIGSPMPSPKLARSVSVSYRYRLSTTFSTTEGPRLTFYYPFGFNQIKQKLKFVSTLYKTEISENPYLFVDSL